MKALTYTLPILLSAMLISGCSQNQFAQQEYDDMYYTAQDREQSLAAEEARLEKRRQAQLEQQQRNEAAAAERTKNAYDQYDAQSAREINPDAAAAYSTEGEEQYYEEEYYTEERAAAPNGTTVYNNHYYNNRPVYDPWMYDPYGYAAGPWGRNSFWGRPGWGSGFSIGFGMGMGMGMGMGSMGGFCDPFWDPWCGSSFYYNAYRPAWAWNGWGYQNPYAHGYRNGFYDGFYGRRNYWGAYYPSTVVIVNSDNNARRNVTYGPRATRTIAAADMGVGSRAANNQGLRDERRQRIQSDVDRSRGTINGGQRDVRPVSEGSRGRGRAVPADRGNRNETTAPTTRPQRAPRTQPARSNETRPQRQPVERTRPSVPQTRPAPQTRPSTPTRGSGGASPSSPTRSRGGRGGEPMSNLDINNNNMNEGRTQRPSSNVVSVQPAQRASQNRQTAAPAEPANRVSQQRVAAERTAVRPANSAERPNEPTAERNSYSRTQRPERRVEAPNRATNNNSSYTSPAPARTYSTPAPQQRATRSYSAPERSSSPARTYSSPAPASRQAPAMNSGGSRSSSGSSATPSRSGGGSSSRSRGN